MHAFMYYGARAYANEVVAAIEAHIVAHGSCPQNLDAVGITNANVRDKLGLAGYFCETGKPGFFYASTYVPFEKEHYDFTGHRWVHVYD